MSKNTDQPQNSIALGKIASAHGVKGLVKILPYGEDPSLITLCETYSITLKNPLGKYILAEIDGVDSREAAEALRGTELCIPKDKLPEIDDPDAFYYEDLLGLTCVDKNGDEVGIVKAVEDFGAGDLLEIKPKGAESFYVPFTDDYVLSVDETLTLSSEYKAFLFE